ncbi:unnamed protein product, partial [Candidula unifasciata]
NRVGLGEPAGEQDLLFPVAGANVRSALQGSGLLRCFCPQPEVLLGKGRNWERDDTEDHK